MRDGSSLCVLCDLCGYPVMTKLQLVYVIVGLLVVISMIISLLPPPR